MTERAVVWEHMKGQRYMGVDGAANRLVYVIILSLWCASALAEEFPSNCPEYVENQESARTLAGEWFNRGMALVEAGDLLGAEQAFRCSNRLVEHPATLLNIAKAARDGGANKRAVVVYRRFLETYPEHEKRNAVKEELLKLESEVDGESPVDVAQSDTQSKSYPDAEESVSESHGSDNQTSDTIDPPQIEKETLPSMGKEQSSSLQLRQINESKKRRTVIAGSLLVGLGGGVLLGSIGTGVAALSQKRHLDERCDDGCDPPYHGDIDRMNRLAYTTDALIGVGVAAAAVGLFFLIRSKRRGTKGNHASTLAPLASPVGVALLGLEY